MPEIITPPANAKLQTETIPGEKMILVLLSQKSLAEKASPFTLTPNTTLPRWQYSPFNPQNRPISRCTAAVGLHNITMKWYNHVGYYPKEKKEAMLPIPLCQQHHLFLGY